MYNEIPKQRDNLHQALRRGNSQWLHSVENIEEKKKEIMSVRCKVKVNGKEMDAIVDSVATTNIMTKGLQEELGVKITEKSNARFTITNGQTVPALGKTMIKVIIENE